MLLFLLPSCLLRLGHPWITRSTLSSCMMYRSFFYSGYSISLYEWVFRLYRTIVWVNVVWRSRSHEVSRYVSIAYYSLPIIAWSRLFVLGSPFAVKWSLGDRIVAFSMLIYGNPSFLGGRRWNVQGPLSWTRQLYVFSRFVFFSVFGCCSLSSTKGRW